MKMTLNRLFDFLPENIDSKVNQPPGIGGNLIFLGSIIFAIGVSWGHVFGYIGAGIVLLGAIISLRFPRFKASESILILLFLSFFAWGIILSLFVAVRPAEGFQTVFAYFAHWMIPFAVGLWLPNRYKKAVLYLWLLSLFVLGLVSFLAFAGLYDSPRLSKQGMLFGLHNHIQFAALLLLGFNVIYGLFLTPDISRKKLAYTGILGGIFLLLFILAGSRGWWVAAIISAGGLTAHHIITNRNRKMALIIAAAGIFLAAGSIALFPQVRQRIENTNFNDPNYIHRRNMAVMAWEIIKENPILGIGPGQTPYAKEYYDRMAALNLPQETGYLNKKHFHNIYLQMAAEFGAPGLIFFLAIIFWSFRILIASAKSMTGNFQAGIIYGVIWSFAALMVAELFDCLLRGPAVAMEYFWVLGLCAGMGHKR